MGKAAAGCTGLTACRHFWALQTSAACRPAPPAEQHHTVEDLRHWQAVLEGIDAGRVDGVFCGNLEASPAAPFPLTGPALCLLSWAEKCVLVCEQTVWSAMAAARRAGAPGQARLCCLLLHVVSPAPWLQKGIVPHGQAAAAKLLDECYGERRC